MIEDEEDEGPFRYRSGVRLIAVCDVILSMYLLVYLAAMVFLMEIKDTDIPQGNLTDKQLWHVTLGMWIAFAVIYGLQLILGFVLICACSNNDASVCRSKCQLWLYYANLVCLALVVEIGLLVFNFSRHGMRVYPLASWGVKIIFRLIARQLVKYYIKDLDTVPPNTVEAQFYSGIPRMYQYSSEYLAQDLPPTGKKKENRY